jgi:hypothetical protein
MEQENFSQKLNDAFDFTVINDGRSNWIWDFGPLLSDLYRLSRILQIKAQCIFNYETVIDIT